VIRNLSYLTMRSVVKEPPDAFTYDPAENRRSIHKLANLEPSVILPGHGAAVTDIAKFERFVTKLPATDQPPADHRPSANQPTALGDLGT
jgi:glyoxylase-like metal-dependent hydrolase (beta-lactamase superfamily II)